MPGPGALSRLWPALPRPPRGPRQRCPRAPGRPTRSPGPVPTRLPGASGPDRRAARTAAADGVERAGGRGETVVQAVAGARGRARVLDCLVVQLRPPGVLLGGGAGAPVPLMAHAPDCPPRRAPENGGSGIFSRRPPEWPDARRAAPPPTGRPPGGVGTTRPRRIPGALREGGRRRIPSPVRRDRARGPSGRARLRRRRPGGIAAGPAGSQVAVRTQWQTADGYGDDERGRVCAVAGFRQSAAPPGNDREGSGDARGDRSGRAARGGVPRAGGGRGGGGAGARAPPGAGRGTGGAGAAQAGAARTRGPVDGGGRPLGGGSAGGGARRAGDAATARTGPGRAGGGAAGSGVPRPGRRTRGAGSGGGGDRRGGGLAALPPDAVRRQARGVRAGHRRPGGGHRPGERGGGPGGRPGVVYRVVLEREVVAGPGGCARWPRRWAARSGCGWWSGCRPSW